MTLAGQIHVVQALLWKSDSGLCGHFLDSFGHACNLSRCARTLLCPGPYGLFPPKTHKDVSVIADTPSQPQTCRILLRLKDHIAYTSVAVLVNLKPPEKRCNFLFIYFFALVKPLY